MTYSKVNIDELDDQAAAAGIKSQEARFVRGPVDAERIGLAHYRVRPGQRLEFGHRHRSMEEVYVVVAGSGTFRVDDESVDVAERDVVRIPPTSWRGWEAGPDGMELLAFGEHVEGADESELDMEWWPRS
jgi:mannose-6-phosphate isomerase-like protein (cupin superfamily)